MSDANTHTLLTDEQDPPDPWETGWIGGDYISFRRPTDQEDHVHYVVISVGGDRGEAHESRPVEVWAVTIPEGRILRNWKDAGDTVGEDTGMSNGAVIALEYMQDRSDD